MTKGERTAMLARVRELDAAATQGPWDITGRDCGDNIFGEGCRRRIANTYGDLDDPENKANAESITEYRTIAPALADEVERLAAEVERLRDVGGRLAESLEAKRPKGGHVAMRWHDTESELDEWRELIGQSKNGGES